MKKLIACIFIVTLFALVGCGQSSSDLTADEIVQAFQDAGLPVENVQIYNEENCPNGLLGRPQKYVGKASWADVRIEQTEIDDFFEDDPIGGTVEVFTNKKDLESRQRYLESISDTYKDTFFELKQYTSVHKNALLRLEYDLTPTQAKEYEDVLKSL